MSDKPDILPKPKAKEREYLLSVIVYALMVRLRVGRVVISFDEYPPRDGSKTLDFATNDGRKTITVTLVEGSC